MFGTLVTDFWYPFSNSYDLMFLQDIKALFPADYNPFYAGFGNRDTDELTYRKMGIPKGKIFIINPKVFLLQVPLLKGHKN